MHFLFLHGSPAVELEGLSADEETHVSWSAQRHLIPDEEQLWPISCVITPFCQRQQDEAAAAVKLFCLVFFWLQLTAVGQF